MADEPPIKANKAMCFAEALLDASPEQFALAQEILRERGWVCPTHGDVGRKVDGSHCCAKKGCGEPCTNDGRLICEGTFRAQMLRATADYAAVLPEVLAKKGLKQAATKQETHNHLTLVFSKSEDEIAAMSEKERELYFNLRLLAAGKAQVGK